VQGLLYDVGARRLVGQTPLPNARPRIGVRECLVFRSSEDNVVPLRVSSDAVLQHVVTGSSCSFLVRRLEKCELGATVRLVLCLFSVSLFALAVSSSFLLSIFSASHGLDLTPAVNALLCFLVELVVDATMKGVFPLVTSAEPVSTVERCALCCTATVWWLRSSVSAQRPFIEALAQEQCKKLLRDRESLNGWALG
jgi:hypothetical protein